MGLKAGKLNGDEGKVDGRLVVVEKGWLKLVKQK